MTEKKVEVKLVPNKDGLLVPEDSLPKGCVHAEVAQRIAQKPTMNRYHCHDCDEKVNYVTFQYALMTDQAHQEFKEQLAKTQAEEQAKAKRKKIGLVLPGDKESK